MINLGELIYHGFYHFFRPWYMTYLEYITWVWSTDGSWKENDRYSGQGCYSTLEGFDSLMGAGNTRVSQSPIHSEIEALIWGIECMRNLRQFRLLLRRIVLNW